MAQGYPFSQGAVTANPNATGAALTGTPNLAAAPTGYDAGNQLAPAIQTIWSKEILFQAMPILRFEQFAVKKTELGVAPGLTINFMRYINLPADQKPLVEGVRLEPKAITAEQYSITVTEHGYAVAVSELLLNASFDDVMASASRLLGRNMALYLDGQARDTLLTGTSQIFGYKTPAGARTPISPYDAGVVGTAATADQRRAVHDPRGQGRRRDPRQQERPPPRRDLRLLRPPPPEPFDPGHPGVHRGHEVRRTRQLHAR